MKSITFPQANVNIAEDQEQYNTLPSFVGKVDDDNNVGMVCCFEITDEELLRIIKYRKLWYRALTFGQPLQPFNIMPVEDYFEYDDTTDVGEIHHKVHTMQKEVTIGWWDRFKSLFTTGKYKITYNQTRASYMVDKITVHSHVDAENISMSPVYHEE